MLDTILPYINFTQLLVVVTFITALVCYDSKNKNHRILLGILSICFINELLSFILLFRKADIGLVYSVNALLHHCLWLWLLFKIINRPKLSRIILIVYIAFGLFNLFFGEGMTKFNYDTFIAGGLLYVMLFIYESFVRLKREDFAFFLSNYYVLLSAPVLFFFGLSFIFGFKSRELSSTVLFGSINLYAFIGLAVNSIYYSLINIYFYNDKKRKHGI